MLVFSIVAGIVFLSGIILKIVIHLKFKKQDEKTQARIVLGHFIGRQLILAGGILSASAILFYFRFHAVVILLSLLFLAVVVYTLLEGKNLFINPQLFKKQIGLMTAAFFTLIIIVSALIGYALLEPQINYTKHHLIIRGAEGIKIPWADVDAMSNVDYIPTILDLNKGWKLGKTYRGIYELYKSGPAHLFIEFGMDTYVIIWLKEGIVVLTRDNPEATQQLYDDIRKHWLRYIDTVGAREFRKKFN
jgi:hypothetical protein